MKYKWITDSWQSVKVPEDTQLILADPVYDSNMINDMWSYFAHIESLPTIMFMYPEDVSRISSPDRVCHWFKTPTSKNTSVNYSRNIEAIAMKNLFMSSQLHANNRIGYFTDVPFHNFDHPWQKPEALIERLILNHYNGGRVYDPCAGSGTTMTVCRNLQIPCTCVEIDPKYQEPKS